MNRFQTFTKVENENLINSTLRSIELCVTTSCNRACSFCPHAWGFKTEDTREKFVSMDVVDRFIEITSEYKNQVTLCGMGEPTLHPQIKEILNKFQDVDYKVILVTNGYKLEEVVPHLGNIRPRVSLYEPMELPDIDMDVINYYEEGENVNFNQRSYSEGIKKPCYLPSYKMVVDTTGGILPCDNNWQEIEYLANIFDYDLETVWLDKFNPFRTNCSKDRSLNNYCRNCDAGGILYGSEEMQLLTNQ